jgi:hypothetical protein
MSCIAFTLAKRTMAQHQSLHSGDPGSRFDRCRDQAHDLLRKAADQWTLGHPEEPPTRGVLEQILRIFEREHFLRRGFNQA